MAPAWAPAEPAGQLRLARPDGSLGIGAAGRPAEGWRLSSAGDGVVARRDVEQVDEVDLSWTSADDLALARARAAAAGVAVDAAAWNTVYTASRRYLVPD